MELKRTQEIGDVTINVVTTETDGLCIVLVQGDDVIALSGDESIVISSIIYDAYGV